MSLWLSAAHMIWCKSPLKGHRTAMASPSEPQPHGADDVALEDIVGEDAVGEDAVDEGAPSEREDSSG